ncbi:Hypothetical_protein [Hexamita inflata]|uniref:Hypothetical_protein n=1 Tax=Hexamita inflata TaxID=28002 RepID=A0AA86VUN1_9EUKA|nr:Hypothetical protein HINF_LOCUS66588 [Hexamita inflata]
MARTRSDRRRWLALIQNKFYLCVFSLHIPSYIQQQQFTASGLKNVCIQPPVLVLAEGERRGGCVREQRRGLRRILFLPKIILQIKHDAVQKRLTENLEQVLFYLYVVD